MRWMVEPLSPPREFGVIFGIFAFICLLIARNPEKVAKFLNYGREVRLPKSSIVLYRILAIVNAAGAVYYVITRFFLRVH